MIFCDVIFALRYSAIISTGNLVELSSTKGRKQLFSCQSSLSTKGQQIWNSTRSKVSSSAMWCCRWVYDFVLQLKFQDGHSGLEVTFHLSRPLTSSLLTTFLPTTILVLITHLANAFSKNYLAVVIQVNLTVLLVLATL